MTRTRFISLSFLLTTTFLFHDVIHAKDITSSTQTEEESINDYNGQDMIDWIRSNGGTINPKQEIRREIPNDTSTPRGVFATANIAEGEILASIPWDLIIKRRNYNSWKEWDCDTVRVLIEEMKLGTNSKFAPYVNYLLEESTGQIPVGWSKEGRRLLAQVTGEELPPYQEYIDFDSWQTKCGGGEEEPFEEQAFNLVLQRAEDTLMIPFFDMYNHRNGRWLNTVVKVVPNERFEVKSRHDITVGTQIFLTYNHCNPCDRLVWDTMTHDDDCWLSSNTGTPEILQNFGFVESMPQGFHIYDSELMFCIDEKEEDEDGELEVVWLYNTEYEYEVLLVEMARLEKVEEEEKLHRNESIMQSDYEWGVIWRYHQALTTAFTKAIEVAEELLQNEPLDGEIEAEDYDYIWYNDVVREL